jgi:hypothetical protein
MKYKHTMKGPKTCEEWVEVYEERDSDTEYILSPGERIVFDPMYGFFTYCFDAPSGTILVPKMCGDGKYWRKQIYRLAKATRHLGINRLLCCTKRNPFVYMRVLGGKLHKMEHTYNFVNGKETTLWYILISFDDTRVADPGPDSPAGCQHHGGLVGPEANLREGGGE